MKLNANVIPLKNQRLAPFGTAPRGAFPRQRLRGGNRAPLFLYDRTQELQDNSDIFEFVTPEEKKQILSTARLREYEVGDILFQQGDPHDGIFIILSGRARTHYISARGREITLAYWPEHHFVGGPGILGGDHHIWTAEADEPCKAAFLSGQQMLDLIHTNSNFALGLIQGLAYKGKCYSAHLQLIGTNSASSLWGVL